MRKLITVVIVLVLAAAGSWLMFSPKEPAPAVTFDTLSGEKITMASLQGKVVLVKFWATSCVTCVKQMPDTVALYDKYHRDGLEVIAVAMSYDPVNYVKQFTTSRQLPFTVAIDGDGSVAKAFDDVKLTPIAFLIDRQGNIVKRYLGNYDKQDMQENLEAALVG